MPIADAVRHPGADAPPLDLMIRIEVPSDAPAIRELNRKAFGRETEAALVDALRENAKFMLSLVACVNGKVIGHLLFTEMLGATQRLAVLAPMAVLPGYQRRGVGSALVREGLQYLREQSYIAAIVLGHKDFYPRFGFRPAGEFGVRTPFDESPGYLLIAPLSAVPVQAADLSYQSEFDALAT